MLLNQHEVRTFVNFTGLATEISFEGNAKYPVQDSNTGCLRNSAPFYTTVDTGQVWGTSCTN